MRSEFSKSNAPKSSNQSSADLYNVKIDDFNQKTLIIFQVSYLSFKYGF